MSLLISVIVPVYRDWKRLGVCLDALERQSIPVSDFEIIVVNNEPGAAEPDVHLPSNARLIHEGRVGSYAARNTAVASARGRFLAFTDSDCVPSREWLEQGLHVLAEHPRSRVTGPIPIFREPGGSRIAFVYEFHTAFKQEESARSGTCATANLIVPRAVLDAVGPFSENLVSGGDTEWSERAQKGGFPLIYHDAVWVSHPARRSITEIIQKKRRLAGSIAQRKSYPTYRYFIYRLLPPLRHYYRRFVVLGRGPIQPLDWILLFFVHWVGQLAEGAEFLSVRRGWKSPNRS